MTTPRPLKPLPSAYPCKKCCGTGNVGYRRAGGVCFKCGGDGVNAGAYADALAVYRIEAAAWDREDHAETEANATAALAEHERLCAERGEPSCPFERLMAGLSMSARP